MNNWWQSFQNNEPVSQEDLTDLKFLIHVAEMLRDPDRRYWDNDAILTRILDYLNATNFCHHMNTDVYRNVIQWLCCEYPEGLLRDEIVERRRGRITLRLERRIVMMNVIETHMEQNPDSVARLLPIYLRTVIENQEFTHMFHQINLDFALKHEDFCLALREMGPRNFARLFPTQQVYLLNHDCGLDDEIIVTIWISLVVKSRYQEAIECWPRVSHFVHAIRDSPSIKGHLELLFRAGDVANWDSIANLLDYDISQMVDLRADDMTIRLDRRYLNHRANQLLVRYLSYPEPLPITDAIVNMYTRQGHEHFYQILDETNSHARFSEKQIAEILHYVNLQEDRPEWWKLHYPGLVAEHLLYFRDFVEAYVFINHSTPRHLDILNDVLGSKCFFNVVIKRATLPQSRKPTPDINAMVIPSMYRATKGTAPFVKPVYSHDTEKGFRVLTTGVPAKDIYEAHFGTIDAKIDISSKKSARK